MKTMIMTLVVAIASISCLAKPHLGPRPMPRPPIHRVAPHHHHHYQLGSSFVSSFVGSLVGSAIVKTVQPAPMIVTAPPVQPTLIVQSPIVTTRQIWIEGKYEDQTIYGAAVRVWVPGHWETICQ